MFDEKELEIIKYGAANGKTKQEVEKALANYRLKITPNETKEETAVKNKSYIERLKTGFVKESLDIGEGVQRGAELMGQGKSTQGSIRAGLSTAGGVARIIFSPITEALSPLISPLVEKAASNEQAQSILKNIDSWAKQNPDAAANLKNIVDIASTVTGAKGAKVATPAIKSGAVKTGETLLKGTELAGKTVKAGGKEIFETGIPMSAREAKLVQIYNKSVPFVERVKRAITGEKSTKPITNADTAFRNVFGGTESMIGTQSLKAKDSLWSGLISPALKRSKEILTKDELFSGIAKKISTITDPIKKASYEDAFNFVKDSYKSVDNWTMENAQKLKQDLAEFIPEAVYNGKPIANELKAIKNEMAGIIRGKIYKSLGDINARQAYLDYGNLENLAKWGQKAMTGSKLKGGAGGFVSAMKDMVLTPIATVGGKILYRTGEGLEFIGEKGAKTFKDLLKN